MQNLRSRQTKYCLSINYFTCKQNTVFFFFLGCKNYCTHVIYTDDSFHQFMCQWDNHFEDTKYLFEQSNRKKVVDNKNPSTQFPENVTGAKKNRHETFTHTYETMQNNHRRKKIKCVFFVWAVSQLLAVCRSMFILLNGSKRKGEFQVWLYRKNNPPVCFSQKHYLL